MITSSMTVLLAAGITLNYSGCSKESPIGPDTKDLELSVQKDTDGSMTPLAKVKKNKDKKNKDNNGNGNGNGSGQTSDNESSDNETSVSDTSATDTSATDTSDNETSDNNDDSGDYSINVSKTFTYEDGKGQYKGGNIKFGSNNKSKFTLEKGALTPPPDVAWGEPVTITIQIEYDASKQELLYTFGPHGCQFSPRAMIKLEYSELGIDVPTLFYIDENGDYNEQQPNQIDINKKWLKIRVDHFSRYAVAWAN